MLLKRYSRHAIFALSLLSMLAIFSRCTSSSSGGSGSATTFAISGNISVGQTASSMSSMSVNANAAPFVGEVHAQATQCGDGYYYVVRCVSYAEDGGAATGAVNCSGGNSGSFTVAGLPLNADIGCFVRRALTDTTNAYSTIGTVEIPTTSLSGGTSTLVSQGDLNLDIALNTDGSITTTVTGGGDNVVSPVESISNVDTAQYTGFWSIQCDSTTISEEFSPVRCKCQNGGQEEAAYQQGGSKNPNPGAVDPEQACVNDNAAEVTDAETQEFVEINMYTATPQSNLTIDEGIVIPSGTAVPVISVWSASSASTSARAGGGEGAGSSVKDKDGNSVTLNWSATQATDPITWATTGTVSGSNGVDLGLGTSAGFLSAALSSPTAANWKAWVADIYDNAGTTGFTCTWGNAVSGSTDAGCLSEFADRQLADNRTVNLPIVRIHRMCDQNGCDADVTHAQVHVEGYHADYSGVAPGDVDAVVLQSEGVSPELRTRYVFEPFEATPSGGGFTQNHYNNRSYSCDDTAGQQVQNAACTGADGNWVNCGIREEVSIKFKPTSSTAMTLFFEQRGIVAYATLEKWTTGTKTNGTFAEALAICDAENESSEARFQMTATKQP